MGWYAGLNRLRDVLADLYPAASVARTVVAEAGIPELLIDFEGSAVVFWKSILTKAQNNDQVQALIDVARSHFPTNAALIEAERIFHETPVPLLPRGADEPAPSGNNGGSGNVSISVGGNSSGIIAGRDVNNAKVQNVGDVRGDGNVIGIDTQVSTVETVTAAEQPSRERFAAVVQELQLVLAKIAEQSDLLSQVDPAARYTIPGAAQELNDVAAELQSSESTNRRGILERLKTAATLTESVLDKAKSLADKATDAGKAAMQLVAQLGPVVVNLETLIVWTTKLWLA